MGLSCADCGLAYSSPYWADFVVPDEVWAKIAPTPCVLCVQCMVNRAVDSGVEEQHTSFTSGPFANHRWTK